MSKIIKPKEFIEDNPRRLPEIKDITGFSFLQGTQEESASYCNREDIFSPADVIGEATQKAKEIMDEAERKAAEIYARAKVEGFNEGKREAAMIINQAEEKARQILKEAEKEREKRILDSEREILKLSVQIAEKIIRQKITSDKETILESIRHAAEKMKETNGIKIQVNPAFLEVVQNKLPELKADLHKNIEIEIAADPHLEPGDFRLESRNGSIDGRISQQLAIILEQLLSEELPAYEEE